VKATWLATGALWVHACSVAGSAQPSDTQEQASLAQCRELTRFVMTRIIAGADRDALELLRPKLAIAKDQFDSLRDQTIEQRSVNRTRFGKALGFKLISEEHVSDFLVRFTYVETRTNQLLRWQFTFFRPEGDWRLASFTWDDDIAALFDSTASTPIR
jgi:hypothetical protein